MKNKITWILSPVILLVLYLSLTSSSGGITGVSTTGCTCHGVTNPQTVVSISGLPPGGYTNGTVYPITISVTNTTITPSSGGFGLGDGFNMSTTSGAFTSIAGTTLNGALEILHTQRKVPVAGTASWTFNWTAPASGSANITFSVSGNATNGNGTSAGDAWNQTSTTIYKAGAVLAVTATAPNISCFGNVATITAVGSGPTVPYTYSRNGGAFQSSGTFTNNVAGTYTITVRNSALATATTTVTITQPTIITIGTTSATPINCNGGTSTITTSATGGTGAFNYRLNLGAFQSSGTFLNNLAGTYTVTARDAAFCTKTSTIVITQPPAMVFSVPAVTPPPCNGGTGSVSTSASGGTGSKTYTIHPLGPQSNAIGTFSGLTAQSYTVTATDGNSCTKTTLITISQPSLITFGAPTISNVLCNGETGSVVITASGGVGTKTYTISPLGPQSNTTGNFSGLTAQSYTITATDANSCTKTTLITISQPSLITFGTPAISNALCNGGTGSVLISATGGVGTKTYTISPLGPQSNTTGSFTGLTAQSYTITVTDVNSCTKTSLITITQPSPLVVLASDVSGCIGDSIPLNATPPGGTFNVPNPYIGNSTSYIYTVTDGNGCVGIDTAQIFVNSVSLSNTNAYPGSVCVGGISLLSTTPSGLNCIPVNTTNGCSGQEFISNVTLGTINNSTACGNSGYSDFTDSFSTSITAGSSYSILLSDGAYFPGDQWAVWIDYNHNGVFGDPGELTTFAASGVTSSATLYVPSNALNGPTKMRVRLVFVGPISPCATSTWGETEDYSILITNGLTNINPPFSYVWSGATSSILASPLASSTLANNIDSNQNYTVTVTSAEGCSTVDYLSVVTTVPDLIDHATATPSTVCPGGSAILEVVPTISNSNYCTATNANNGCANVEYIQNVTFNTINHTTLCDTIGYQDYTAISTNLTAGNTYPISLTDGFFSFGDAWGVWIDFNHNGDFNDVGEFTSFEATSAITSGNIMIPSTAFNGTTRMRVRLLFAANPVPCGASTWGEIEDYSVIISGGINPPPYLSYSWSNNLNSNLSSTTGTQVTASNIIANETYQVTATRIDGCFEVAAVAVNIACGSTLNLKLFLEGYYVGLGLMNPVLFFQMQSTSLTLTDSIQVELHDTSAPYTMWRYQTVALNTDGTATCTFDTTGYFYIAIFHRNTVKTWSSLPVNMVANTNYDFTDTSSKAYGANMHEVENGVWAFYQGDLNYDLNVDLLDLSILDADITNFAFGYFHTDLNGDGNVDLLDGPLLEANISNFIYSQSP